MATPSKIYELALYHQDITGNPVMRIIAPDFVSEELDAPEQYFSLPIGSRDMQFNTIMGIQLDIDTIELPDRDWPVLAKRADAATSEAFLQRCLLAHRELGLTQHPDRDGQRGVWVKSSRRWVTLKPGTIELAETPFTIVWGGEKWPYFMTNAKEAAIHTFPTLLQAKQFIEQYCADLEELGVPLTDLSQ